MKRLIAMLVLGAVLLLALAAPTLGGPAKPRRFSGDLVGALNAENLSFRSKAGLKEINAGYFEGGVTLEFASEDPLTPCGVSLTATWPCVVTGVPHPDYPGGWNDIWDTPGWAQTGVIAMYRDGKTDWYNFEFKIKDLEVHLMSIAADAGQLIEPETGQYVVSFVEDNFKLTELRAREHPKGGGKTGGPGWWEVIWEGQLTFTVRLEEQL